jgi:iron-sulfur cluster repair protein YtfE (RIC family)
MNTMTHIHGDTTVNQLLERDPELGATLNALGIDTCCGGGLTLREAAQAAGVPLATVLRALGIEEEA